MVTTVSGVGRARLLLITNVLLQLVLSAASTTNGTESDVFADPISSNSTTTVCPLAVPMLIS